MTKCLPYYTSDSKRVRGQIKDVFPFERKKNSAARDASPLPTFIYHTTFSSLSSPFDANTLPLYLAP